MKQSHWIGMVALILINAVGCVQVKDLPPDEAQAFADEVEPTVENMLNGLSGNDYAMHSRDFDQAMLETIAPDMFPNIYKQIIGALGMPQSRTLAGVQEQNEFIVVKYNVVFDNDPDVKMRVVFAKADTERKITGLWFDSKLLTGK